MIRNWLSRLRHEISRQATRTVICEHTDQLGYWIERR